MMTFRKTLTVVNLFIKFLALLNVFDKNIPGSLYDKNKFNLKCDLMLNHSLVRSVYSILQSKDEL